MDIDPETLLEWLALGSGSERDLQQMALEQLCMILLISDNVDKCFDRLVAIATVCLTLFICLFLLVNIIYCMHVCTCIRGVECVVLYVPVARHEHSSPPSAKSSWIPKLRIMFWK